MTTRHENDATDALGRILNHSDTARQGFSEMLLADRQKYRPLHRLKPSRPLLMEVSLT